MASVVFIGDPDHPGTDPDTISLSGITFALDEPVSLDDREHAALIGKLRGNSHFHVTHMHIDLLRNMLQASQPPKPASPYDGEDPETPSRP